MRVNNFGLLSLNGAGNVLATGTAGGALWGLGYGLAKPALSNEKYDTGNLAQEITANAVAGGVSGIGLYYGGGLLSKVRMPNLKFQMHYMSADFKLRR